MKNRLCTILSLLIMPFIGLGQTAPDFEVMDTEGRILNLYEDYLDQGKTVVLELFWEGCPPCNEFAPLLGELYKDWGDGQRDVEFIALDVLMNERDADVIAFQTKHGHTWPGVSANGGSLGASFPYRDNQFGTYLGTPTLIVISPDGRVEFSPNGFNRTETGLALIDAAIRSSGATKATDDFSGPAFSIEPAMIPDITCLESMPTQEELFATDDCGVLVIATIDEYQEVMCDTYSIIHRWTAIDSCDNSTVLTRTFNVLPDLSPPTFDKQPSPIQNVNCGDPNPEPEVLTASSPCGLASVEFVIDNFTPDLCTSNTITYRWIATSPCGVTAETTVSFVTTFDRQAPVFDSEPDSIRNIRCSQALPSPQSLTATTGCTDVTVAFSVDDYEEDLCNGYPITYRWTASDACGRSTVMTRTFTVLPDTTELIFSREPTPFSDISCGTPFPTANMITYSSRCISSTPVTISVDRSSEEPCGRTITYRYIATDPCGNEIVKTSSFQIEEEVITTKTVTGVVTNSKNAGISDVTLTFSGATSTSITTNGLGRFTIPDLPIDANYTVRPSREGDLSEGVTSFDLVQITSHILGVTPFTNDAQLIAADVNLSNSVTAFDVVLIRKVILGIDNTFEAGSWRFMPEQIELTSLREVGELAFTGIKMGDVTGAADLTTSVSQPRTRKAPVNLVVNNQPFQRGEIVEAVFTTSGIPLTGFQFTLGFDSQSLQLLAVENLGLTDFTEANINLLQKERGRLALSWYDVEQAGAGALFKVRFKATEAGQLKDLLSINSLITKKEAYPSTSEIVDIDLQFQEAGNTISNIQIFPNPTTGHFTLQTYFEEATSLLVQVINLEGKVLQEVPYQTTISGIQTIPMSLPTLPSGMYWIKISDELGKQEIKKIVRE